MAGVSTNTTPPDGASGGAAGSADAAGLQIATETSPVTRTAVAVRMCPR
jgi:hypothetical protein